MANRVTGFGAILDTPGSGNTLTVSQPIEIAVLSNPTQTGTNVSLVDTKDTTTIFVAHVGGNSTVTVSLDGLTLDTIYVTGTGTTVSLVRRSR